MMNTTDFNFSYDDLAITFKDMQDICPKETEGLEDFYDVYTEIIEEGRNIIAAKGGFTIIDDIEILKDSIKVSDTHFETGKIIAGSIRKSEKIAVFACTAGPGIKEEYERHIKERDPLKAFLVDTLGTVAVEKAMDMIHDSIKSNLASAGLFCTNRYSPGYCGWNVSEQFKLWKFLPAGYCGISLTDSALMLPIKSVSGIIGIGKDVRKQPYKCSVCELDNCIYRKIKSH
jgi:hypothetical protein